ncbi:MAG: hypothetical protein K1X53_04320 [Candidatus Sumerlaeaceae bacterium]|nr:hypothetical protein [Candidatus Sumerlaeaceae bacterium]
MATLLIMNRRLAAAFDESGSTLPLEVARRARLRADLSLVKDFQREEVQIPAMATVAELRTEYDRLYGSAKPGTIAPKFEEESSNLRADVERRKQREIREKLDRALKNSLQFEVLTSPTPALSGLPVPMFWINGSVYTGESLADFASMGSSTFKPTTSTLERFEDMALFLEAAKAKGRTETETYRLRLEIAMNDAKAREWIRKQVPASTNPAEFETQRLKFMQDYAETMKFDWNADALAPYAL